MVDQLKDTTTDFAVVEKVVDKILETRKLNIPEFVGLPAKETIVTLLVVFAESHETYDKHLAVWSSQVLMLKMLSCGLKEDAKSFLKLVEDRSFLAVFESVLRSMEIYDSGYNSSDGSTIFRETYKDVDLSAVLGKLQARSFKFHIAAFLRSDFLKALVVLGLAYLAQPVVGPIVMKLFGK